MKIFDKKTEERMSLKELDREVASIWGVEVVDYRYCHPYNDIKTDDSMSESERFYAFLINDENLTKTWVHVFERAMKRCDCVSWRNIAREIVLEKVGELWLKTSDLSLYGLSEGSVEIDDEMKVKIYSALKDAELYLQVIKEFEKKYYIYD